MTKYLETRFEFVYVHYNTLYIHYNSVSILTSDLDEFYIASLFSEKDGCELRENVSYRGGGKEKKKSRKGNRKAIYEGS